MRVLRTLSLPVLFIALGTAPAAGQQAPAADSIRTLSSSALDATVAGHDSAVDRQRVELAELLSRPEVRDAAQARGIDMGRVESAAAGLTDAQVRTVAPMVTAVVQDDSGGLGTVTIGVGTLIVILLLLIVLT